ncbi:(Fe-S)-binding protein [Nitrosomonas sp. HPC101]|uniref:(Fe-S)-binding protein n=1 Tax=Nitrosomonas sp. HPC101 TaxID=1658667 RepID=UPI00136B7E81|nr:(Fe-S)-binding protein [Nitrosomonas sp. HPC101]MXS86184.1 (Fe-S)-binding protein [Nitrosomonas sp. HPC101]
MKKSDQNYSLTEELLAEANRCVACGLCLPHCPTYHLTYSEADSPRGRIALMSGVASKRIPLNGKFIQHMDRCLTCRACENVCPSHVAYGRLIDDARVMIYEDLSLPRKENQGRKSWLRNFLERELIARPARLDMLRPILRLLAKSGLLSLCLQLNMLKKNVLAQSSLFLTTRSLPGQIWRSSYSARGSLRGEVALFLGCVARLIDTETLLSTISVLNRLGYTVHVPKTQTCCGALHQHSGQFDVAASLAQQNIRAFEGLNIQAIIHTASGCGVQLTEYSLRMDAGFPVPVMDISQFLNAQEWNEINFIPLSRKIVVHEPCTLRNTLHASRHLYSLLQHIPGIEVVELPGNDRCCGAAGTYFLDQPEFAGSLLDEKLQAFEQTGANCLVTANIGCALHIANGLAKKGRNIEVLHPVTLLARQICIK